MQPSSVCTRVHVRVAHRHRNRGSVTKGLLCILGVFPQRVIVVLSGGRLCESEEARVVYLQGFVCVSVLVCVCVCVYVCVSERNWGWLIYGVLAVKPCMLG